VKVLMLAPRMALGYGVAEAVAMQVRKLRQLGIQCEVGCLERDGTYDDVSPRRVAADPDSIRFEAARTGARVVIAHGTPYFEALPALAGDFWTIAYEYGDPTPELFDHDAAERRRIADRKRRTVYPAVDAVAAISEFIRHDIGWPDARVVRLGTEHIADVGAKQWLPPRVPAQPLRVGALMRLGAGEARYKGHAELLELRARVAEIRPEVTFEIMGRGESQDAAAFQAAGFRTHLNASTVERLEYLRGLDVFVTTSLWEGTNLPLVEAQALGTPGLAFDTGAHPEFTPLVFASIEEMAVQIDEYAYQPDLLSWHGRMSYQFVRGGLTWNRTGLELLRLISEVTGAAERAAPPRPRLMKRQVAAARRLRGGLRESGWRDTVRYHSQRLRRR
jgi:hypothetical protein